MRENMFIVDSDVHYGMKRKQDLLPYLAKVWHERWLEMGSGSSRQYHSSVGGAWEDTHPDDGEAPGGDPVFTKKQLLDEYDIDYAVLAGGIEVSLHPDPGYASAVAAAYNDYTIEHWLAVSPKFKGSILINATDPIAAANEIDRLGTHPDMVQIIMTGASRMLYGQRFFDPIFEAAERNGLPVAIHSSMAQINSLICAGVFEKYPDLKCIAIEGGISWLSHLMRRMDKNYKERRDSMPWLKKLPSEYVKEHIYLRTQPMEEPPDPMHLTQTFEMIEVGRMVMFSSDYPNWDFDNPFPALPLLPKEVKRNIMGYTAAKLFRLDIPGARHGAREQYR